MEIEPAATPAAEGETPLRRSPWERLASGALVLLWCGLPFAAAGTLAWPAGWTYLGVLAALLKGKDLATAVQWGAAHGILVQETPGDITMVEEKLVTAEVKRVMSGGGVKAVR